MGCVNKNGSEFKNLATKHNLDANTLELIVHKYWLQTGREDLFPTDVYIQAQLGNGVYKESGKAVRKLWNKYYSSTQEFSSMERLQAAYNKAVKYFPMSAIYYYKNAKDNYVLSVKRPVEKTNYTKDDFFDDYDNIGSMRNVKILNLDIEQDKSYGIGKIQDLFNRFNTDRTSKELADKVFTIAKDLGIKVIFNESLPFGTMGRYQNNNTIILKKSFLERDFMNDKKAAIMLHEVLHSLSMYALSGTTKNWGKPKALDQFKTEMNSLYQDLKSNPLLKNERGIVDVKEFVAELANPVFRSKIQEIDKQNKAKENKSFWNKILNAFKHLLGIHASDSYYERSMNALNKALNAFDIDTYMRYNGIKNKLRKEIANNKVDTQLNKTIDVIKDAAVSGKWTTEALKELNNLINDLEDGKITYQRFPKEASRAYNQGGRANAAASLLLGASNGTSTNDSRSFSESQRRSQEEKPIQERIIENWAKAEGIWHDNLNSIKGKKQIAEGGEAKVFFNGNEKKVTKLLSTRYFITPQLTLDRINIHNTLFPAATLKITGFGRNSKGEFLFIVEQPFIQGEPASQKEIDMFITKMGFVKSTKDNGHTFVSDDLYLSDLHDKNVIKTPQGDLIVIDADLRLNTPNLNREGRYEINNSITSAEEANANEFIRTLSLSQLDNEKKLIKQEEADYDVLFDIEPVGKKSGKAVPQDFTFADGTTIKAPFKPNEQQEDALNAMSRFIKSNETSMTLSGYAGTGKTSIMEMIAKKCKKQGKKVLFCATTNKAAAVLDSRVSKAGFKATTLNKTFGINVEIDSTQKSYNVRNLTNVLSDVDIMPGTTIIIDEASMINEENYKILNDIAKNNNLKIIYVGDKAQLAPVNEDQISKVFRNGDGKVITLTQVERTDDNAILKEATNIRNGKPLSGETSFNSKGEGVAYISPQHQEAINEVVAHYVPGLKRDPNYFRILAYTNKAVSDYNTQVRTLLGYDSSVPQVGEPMTGYANWGYNWKTKSYRFINSESYKVTKVGNPETNKVVLDDGTIVSLQVIPLTLTDSLGNADTFDFVDIKSNPQNRQAAMMIANEKKRLWNLARHTYGKAAKAQIYSKINILDAHLFVNDNIEDAEHNLLQAKTIDFGYAITIHKSQGSTFTHVLMDDVDVSKSIKSNNSFETIDIGDETPDLSNAKVEGMETVDLGDLSSVVPESEDTTPSQSPTSNVANIKQQLEYVGVSRATDTVTIISNNVKREGSPLHPEENLKDRTINTTSQRSNTTVPHQGFISDEAKQLVEHLKSMGINVLGRDAMQKFFEEHPNILVQMASSNYYMDLDNAKEVEVLRHDLFRQFKNKSSFGCIGHTANYWYLCDYLGDSNYKVRAQIAIDGNEKLINDFEREIRGESFRSPEDFNRRFEAFKAAKGQYYNGGVDAKVRISTNDNVGMAASKLQDRQSANKRGGNEYGSIYNAKEGVEMFLTPQGEVYGFVDKDGNIYLDETKISPEHPIHEYTHLWDRAIAKNNPELWNRGVELMKQTSLWNDVLNDENYGRKWQALKDISQGKLDNLIASEVHARFTGEGGAQLLDKLAKEKGQSGIIAKLKQWILDVWKDLKATFSSWTKEDLDNLTLKDFNHMTVRDFTEGINPLNTNNVNNNQDITQTDVSVFNEEKSYTVKLPGYEYFNDLYEDTTVDAEWKIPYLQKLDSQISNDNTAEENQDIFNQMNTIMDATSEKEYNQQLKDPKGTKKTLSEYERFMQQLDNLLEGGNEDYKELGVTIPASEVRHTAELIINEVSDEITRLQTEEGRAKEIFPEIKTKIDFKTATRRQIVDTIGINTLLDRVKNLFDSETAMYDDDATSLQADLITDNWDAFITMAADIFAFNEGFGITRDYSKGNFTTTDEAKLDYDNFNDYSNDEDMAAENGEKDEPEHLKVEMKTIDVLNSMSALVRQGLRECYLLNENGEKIMSKWGIAERVNPRKATNSILRWTQGSLSLNDMITKLSDKSPKNPWLSQLIEKLSDKSGKYTDFQSQFYGIFSRHHQLYSIGVTENGKYHSMLVNSHPALSDVMRTITSKFKTQTHPLFIGNRIKKKALGNDSTTGDNVDFNLHKALHELKEISNSLIKGNTLDDEMSNKAKNNILDVCRLFGFDITEDALSDVINAETIKSETLHLTYLVDKLDKAYAEQHQGKLKEYNPFKYGEKYGIDGNLSNFLTPITDVMEDTAVSAFYDSGKMYQSYVIPSFMTKLMNKFKLTGQEFQDFMMNEYASSEWFAFNKFGDFQRLQWRNDWLRKLCNENNRKIFAHKVELNFNKHNYMRNMTDAEYTLSLITEYFSESTDKSKSEVPAWFRIPMQSNKPSSDFIRFYSYRGSTYKTSITNNLYEMFLQELSRIQTVKMRNLSKKDAGFIKNFDTNGRKFNFLPIFNAYLEETPTALVTRNQLHSTVEFDETRLMELQLRYDAWEKGDILGTFKDADEYYDLKAIREANDRALTTEEDTKFAYLLQKKLNGEEVLTAMEEAQLGKLALKIIRQSMENRVQSILNTWEQNGVLESAKNIKNIYPTSLDDESAAKYVRDQVENFLWNDALASKNILQLTIGDIAFYKDAEDLQKRLAQLHAPGMRGNIYATDYNGNRVSDGKYRTFILKDFDTFKSNIIANISEVFDRKIAAAPTDQKAALIALKESLVGEDGKYTHINVTDAQGYSSPTSYRKKAFIFGRWSHQAENIYQKLKSGEYNYTDLETAFQPLKPFVYTKLTKDLGVSNAPIHSMQIPFQAKNAEYLLFMADAILQGESLSRPNLLRAVYRVMEDSDAINPTMGIDTVQFESAIKSGLQGTIDISQFMDMPNGEEAAYTYMKNLIYKEGTNDYNKDVFVHETSFDDYCIQQEVPEHFKEHSQAHGSQIRMITPSDLDFYTTDAEGNQVENYYTWKEPDGTVKSLKADEFKKEYEQTIADNIDESLNLLKAELHLDSTDKKERNIALSKILIKEVLSSPRYGVDLMQACSLDENGEFRIPKGDPIQAKRIEQLLNSIIKDRVNKQKIAGGPIVQVTNFGTSKQLHIRFNDKQGNLIPLESEYVPSEHNNLSYKDYIKKNQGGIAYFEVFAPIWSNELVEKFGNPDGSINIEAIEATDPELLKMVSYRIPTEEKYSCAPMKVVGFMPREAGDAIMFPYELTEIDDSDFDVDKRYVMRKDIPIKAKEAGEYINLLEEKGKKLYKEIMDTEAAFGSIVINSRSNYVEKMVDSLVKNPTKFPKNSPFRKALFSEYQKLAYKTEAPLSGRGYRDNKIIDMTYAVLTNEMTADKILNPGGFDAPKKMGYMVAAYKNPANRGIKWSALQDMSIDELKKLSYTNKDLTFADTQVQFYKQNSAAASLIGVFAVNKVAHAVLESNGIYFDVAEVCGDKPFTIADTTFEGKMKIDIKYDQEGTLIGKTLGSLVSASADAVKDPILNLMNINMTTAGMLNTMLRFGMPFNDAALFLSQDIIERLLTQFNRENLTNYVSLDSLITKWLDKYREKNGITDSSSLNTEPLTRDELITGLRSDEHEEIDYKVLLAFQKMRILTDFMRKPTFATRFNSISSAVGPLIIDNLITEHKIDGFKGDTSDTHFYTQDKSNAWVPYSINDTFKAHPSLAKFAETFDIAKRLFMDMPTGGNGFRGLIKALPKDIQNKTYGDKKLMDQFSNFYQSYLLIQSGVVNPSRLSYYINDFPKKFMKEKWNEKYPDNPLIQAIRMNVDSKSKNPYLIINITGIDEQQKEELKYGWIDLHKDNPELSQDLFNYSFFRAGIGFSPKTFMALVPTYVKERLKSTDGQSSYVDTYRNFPEVVKKLVIDQFIRNNWDNNKLAPWKGGKNTHYIMDDKQGTLLVTKAEEIKDVKDFSYIKTSKNKIAYLWHNEGETTNGILFKRVRPLGGNGEYLEMSTSDITNTMVITQEISSNNTPSSMKEVSHEESNIEETPTPVISNTQEVKNLSELADLIMKQVPNLNKEQALNKIGEMKDNERLYRKFLQNVFKQKGLTLNEEEAMNEFKKYC